LAEGNGNGEYLEGEKSGKEPAPVEVGVKERGL
jgi:hypothetical protein